MAEKDMFWGVIRDGSKTFAVVGPPGSQDAARRALGTVAQIEQRCDTAPLQLAPLIGGPPPKAEEKPADKPATPDAAQLQKADKPESNDLGPDTVDAARNFARRVPISGSKTNESKWAMVRAPKP
jgi:hypothetical protein